MEMKIIFEEEQMGGPADGPGPKGPKDMPEDKFPINSTWKEETKKTVLKALDIAGKGDGDLVQDICSKLQEVIDLIDSDNEEPDKDVEAMGESKKDFMDRFQEGEDEE